MSRSTAVQLLLALTTVLVFTTSAFVPSLSSTTTSYHGSISSITKKLRSSSVSSGWDTDELKHRALEEGVLLSLTTLGPGFRAVARNRMNETQILGYCEGFLRPGGSMIHLDKMEVFKKVVQSGRDDNSDFRGGGTVLGVGLFLGFLCLLHGKDKGYSDAEFLAIDDEEKQHRRLVRFYKVSGFKVIRYVGDGVQDIPDRLVWGGCGTLMRETVDNLLVKWESLLAERRR